MTTQSTVSRYLRLLLRQSPEQKRADAVLAGEATAKRGELAEVLVAQATCAVHDPRAKEPAALLRLAKRLRRRSFPINLARRLLRTKFWDDEKEEVLRELAPGLDGEELEQLRREIRAELALVTALATDLSADYRLRRAMEVLQSGGSGPDDPDADRTTLQRAGFICKQLWERGLREGELRQACDYYRRAMDAAETPGGRLSSAAEVAYLLDVQAEVERGGRQGVGGEARIVEADELRRRILAELGSSEELQGKFRSLINLAQMHFGLQQWDEARALLEKARGLKNIPGWLLENTARELVLRGPRGERPGSRPALDNWKRRHKVPMLILNATTLNTGHNWQFTATWMGESPAAIDPQVDSNYRLRRLYLAREAPPPHRRTTLGKAVAASAGVPALFDPTTLRELYEDKLVRLVDGGVFDNQGTASLLEQDCRVMLVSDASGQMDSDDHPSPSPLRVPFRANAILMNRVRQAQYRDLRVREEADLLRHVFYIDLRKDLEGEPVDWVDCVDPKKVARDRHRSQQPRGAGSERRTSYGVIAGLQRKLSDIRTDLDTFCDAEAFALMASGYRQARLEGGRLLERVNELAAESGRPADHRWPFLGDIDGLLCGQRPESERRRKLERLLDVAHERLFRIWRPWLTQHWTRWLFFAALAAGLLVVVRFAWTALFEPHYLVELLREWVHDEDHLAIRVETLATALKVLIGLAVLMPLALVVVPLFPRLLGTLVHSVQLLVLGTVGWAIAWLHLLLFDPWYRRWLPVRPEPPPPAERDPLPDGQAQLTG